MLDMPQKRFFQETMVGETEQRWAVDPQAAAGVMQWIERHPTQFERDVRGMADYFPHWLLIGSGRDKPLTCSDCHTPCVPTAGAIRCPACGGAHRADGLLWVGHIPVLARPEPQFAPRQAALREAGFAEVTTGGATYLLVPLRVCYPSEWPNVEPPVYYARRWLKALGLPLGSGAHHLLPGGRACIFAWNQWQAMPIHAVLQQRMVNHIGSLLKIAAGQRPEAAFIGRIHHRAWQPAT